jgi:Fe-S-cluster containining protein
MSTPPTATVPAGSFLQWLSQMRPSLLSDAGSDVPCGTCVGCCVSAYHIPIRPQDARARASIPREFLVTAPGQPADHAMMKYLDDGTCPMLSAGRCTIYDRRPQTCRDYDCRIFAAAGIDAGPGKPVINKRVHEWRFDYPTRADREAHDAVLTAATFIREKRSAFPGGRAPTAPTGIAVLAIKAYQVFLSADVASKTDEQIAREIIQASREFEASQT